MTILQKQDIADIAGNLAAYDRKLQSILGCGLRELALKSTGKDPDSFDEKSFSKHVAIVPMTCGKGLIPGFSETLQSIARHLGFSAYVTRSTDAAGVAEAFESGADILLQADDDRYTAIDLRGRRVVDNSEATGAGFATGLALMAGGVERRGVLVIGCGPVGRSAAATLYAKGGRIALFDIDPDAARKAAASIQAAAHGLPLTVEKDLRCAFRQYSLVLDATPTAAFIDCGDICEETIIAAPGVPLGVTGAAVRRLGRRLLHDPLQIGTATMLLDAAMNVPPARL